MCKMKDGYDKKDDLSGWGPRPELTPGTSDGLQRVYKFKRGSQVQRNNSELTVHLSKWKEI